MEAPVQEILRLRRAVAIRTHCAPGGGKAWKFKKTASWVSREVGLLFGMLETESKKTGGIV